MDNTENKFFTKTFFWMFLGLIGTAIVAAYTFYSGLCYQLLFSNAFAVVAIIELIAVLVFSFLFRRLSPTVAGIIYFIYAFLNGITLSTIFAIYELNSIVLIFIATAAIFGALAYIGYKTQRNLSDWHTILTVILIVGIIASIVNLFLQNSTLDILLTWGILILFGAFTIYDINIFLRLLRLFASKRN